MKWTMVNSALALSAVLMTQSVGFSFGTTCPSVCACKWKGGKQTVECLQRALITIPNDIDSETQVLDMSENNLQIVPRETFYKANLTNLQKVYLKSCRIGQIGDRAFRGLTNLVELDLSHNLLTAIPSDTFEDTPFLRYLSLADNPIQKVESNAFRMVSGMAKIDLSHCEIQNISPDAFDKLESLEWLKLNGNKLTELHPKTVNSLSRLHGIELHDNLWQCDCKLRSAKEWLSRNGISYAVAPACRGPERVAGRTFAELGIDDFACRPEILPVSRYVEATTGENASVLCRVGAIPAADVHWYWNGRLLLNNSAFSAFQKILIFDDGNFEKSSLLILTNALETDSGEFYCVAENRAGTAEANFTLHVSLRTAGMASFGSGQIAGLSVALITLILAILMVSFVFLTRFKRVPFPLNKSPGQLEMIATVKGNGITTCTKSTCKTTVDCDGSKDSSKAKAIQNHPGMSQTERSETYDFVRKSSFDLPTLKRSGNNPDIIRDAKLECRSLKLSNREGHETSLEASPSKSAWEFDRVTNDPFLKCSDNSVNRGGLNVSDKTPIISEVDDECRGLARANPNNYPPDYGLPMFEEDFDNLGLAQGPALVGVISGCLDGKTARVWQRGVPVLPPSISLKKVLDNSRNSPDEGYQEGCGTNV